MGKPNFLPWRSWLDPMYRFYWWRAGRRQERLLERLCPAGNCVELYDPKTGESDSGWGPVDCPCQDLPS